MRLITTYVAVQQALVMIRVRHGREYVRRAPLAPTKVLRNAGWAMLISKRSLAGLEMILERLVPVWIG